MRAEYGQRQTDLLAVVQQKVEGVLAELDRRLPDIVMGLAERVLGQTSLDRDTVENIVKNLVAEFSGEDEKLEVYLSPDDLKLLKAFVREDVPAPIQDDEEGGFADAIAGIFEGLDGDDALLEGYPNVTFHEDPTLSPGDCQIRSRFGLLDGRMATKLRKIEADLKEQ